jgi:hypothetical protein
MNQIKTGETVFLRNLGTRHNSRQRFVVNKVNDDGTFNIRVNRIDGQVLNNIPRQVLVKKKDDSVAVGQFVYGHFVPFKKHLGKITAINDDGTVNFQLKKPDYQYFQAKKIFQNVPMQKISTQDRTSFRFDQVKEFLKILDETNQKLDTLVNEPYNDLEYNQLMSIESQLYHLNLIKTFPVLKEPLDDITKRIQDYFLSASLTIVIVMAQNLKLTLDCKRGDSVESIKQKIFEKKQIPVDQQHLFKSLHRPIYLEELTTGNLYDNSIKNGQKIYLRIDGANNDYRPIIDIPAYFVDIATLGFFEDPVIANDGDTYQRSTAQDMITRNLAGANLHGPKGIKLKGPLYPNTLIKKAIQDFNDKYQQVQYEKYRLKVPREYHPRYLRNHQGNLFKDPVVAPDGKTYQRGVASKLFPAAQLRQNTNLRRAITDYKDNNQQLTYEQSLQL